MNRLQKLGNSIASGINANADIFMVVGALVGLGCTIALAIKETPAAERIIDDAKDKMDWAKEDAKKCGYSDTELKKTVRTIRCDMAKQLALNYAPAGMSLIATGACIIGSNKVMRSRNAALTGSLNAANLVFQEYRDHVREVIGEKKEVEIHDDIRKAHIERAVLPPEPAIINTGKGNTLCFIELEEGLPESGVYFWSSPEAIHAAVNEANAEGITTGYVSLADFLYFNGLNIKHSGVRQRGWSVRSREDFIELRETSHIHPQNGLPVLDITFWQPPYYGFERFG